MCVLLDWTGGPAQVPSLLPDECLREQPGVWLLRTHQVFQMGESGHSDSGREPVHSGKEFYVSLSLMI